MAGYGIAGADAAMGRILEAAGWKRQCDGFYLLESGGLGVLVRTVHQLEGCPIPAGCHLFETGEVVDLGKALGASARQGSVEHGRISQMAPASAPTAGGSPFADRPMQEQPSAHPDDPLSAMLASGLLDDDDGLSLGGPGFGDKAGISGSSKSRLRDEADPTPDDDDYSDEMLRIFGLR